MGHKDVARWCLPGFQAITDRLSEHEWERLRMQEIINELYTLTA